MRTWSWAAIALALVSAVAGPAAAEDVIVAPSEAQLLDAAAAAKSFDEGDYQGAVAALRAALRKGKVNLFYVNLGRAYFRAGECAQADAAYASAVDSPSVAEPAPAEVRKKVVEYRKELLDTCTGNVVVSCDPEDALVTIDDGSPRPCSKSPFPVSPGFHTLRASYADQEMVREVNVRAMENVGVVLDLGQREGTGAWRGAGLGVGAVGLVFTASAALYQLTVVNSAIDDHHSDPNDIEARDRANTGRTLVLAGYVAGPTLMLVGASLYLLAPTLFDDQEPRADTAQWGAWFLPESAGATWLTVW
jgi:tetratricopeptide (TPR) repeat protein